MQRARSPVDGNQFEDSCRPGAAKIPGDDGLVEVGTGFYCEYQKGRIYYRSGKQPIHVYGAINDKYTQLGGPNHRWERFGRALCATRNRASPAHSGTIYNSDDDLQ